jgi:hypothetical protein
MNSTRSIELSPFLWDIEPLLYVQALPAQLFFGIFQLGWALTLSFPFQHAPMGCNITCDYSLGWIQLTIGGTIPISLRHWTVIVRTGSSSSTIFGIFQLGWANPFVPFQHAPMGCNVHVTTRGWIQLALVRTIPFFETLEPLLYVQALPV